MTLKKKAELGFEPTPVGKLKFPHLHEFQPFNYSIAIDAGLASMLIIYLLTFLTHASCIELTLRDVLTISIQFCAAEAHVILVAGAGCCF